MISTQKVMSAFLAATFLVTTFQHVDSEISVSTHDAEIKINTKTNFTIDVSNLTKSTELRFVVQHEDLLRVIPSVLQINATGDGTDSYTVQLEALSAGKTDVYANSSVADVDVGDVYMRVTVYRVQVLDTISVIIGWLYFVAWSVSFYPQIYINYTRKSVIGLNFDFLSLNIVGFILYSLFNIGLFWIPEIKKEYFERYPRGLNPVQVNDIVFSVHAAFATVVTIYQCFIYERGNQKISKVTAAIHAGFGLFLLASILWCGFGNLHWLDFLYFCSYVKLAITLIKYVPQAYMNYRRKSTVGWSIGNVLLDFTGGMLSMLQMLLIAYNYDDWRSIFGDPTKFGLGLFSVVFDIFFIVQHYVLYRETGYEER